jgi:hypothetical protein
VHSPLIILTQGIGFKLHVGFSFLRRFLPLSLMP